MVGIGNIDVSEQIKRRRVALGLSLRELARRADTSAATLSRYEHGWERFELQTLKKLATALSCDLQVSLTVASPTASATEPSNSINRLQRLFWDRPLELDDLIVYPRWVVERVLEYGTLDDIRTLQDLMGREPFLQTVATARFTSKRTAAFWNAVLKKEGYACTRKFSRNTAWIS